MYKFTLSIILGFLFDKRSLTWYSMENNGYDIKTLAMQHGYRLSKRVRFAGIVKMSIDHCTQADEVSGVQCDTKTRCNNPSLQTENAFVS